MDRLIAALGLTKFDDTIKLKNTLSTEINVKHIVIGTLVVVFP